MTDQSNAPVAPKPVVASLFVALDVPVAQAVDFNSAAVLTRPGLRDLVAERLRQIERHKFTLEHDMALHPGQIAALALDHMQASTDLIDGKQTVRAMTGTAREHLIKATAIAWALIDRLDHEVAGAEGDA